VCVCHICRTFQEFVRLSRNVRHDNSGSKVVRQPREASHHRPPRLCMYLCMCKKTIGGSIAHDTAEQLMPGRYISRYTYMNIYICICTHVCICNWWFDRTQHSLIAEALLKWNIRLYESWGIYKILNMCDRWFQIWRPSGGRDDFWPSILF